MTDFEQWLSKFANIPTGRGKTRPFVPNPGQKRAFTECAALRGSPGLYPIVKGRQGGFTTFFLLYVLYKCLTKDLFSVLIVASNEEPVGLEVLAKWRRLISLLEHGSGFNGYRNDNKSETIFRGTNSRVSWAHIGATDSVADQVGRGGTYDLVILTEYGFPHSAEFARSALEALEPALERSNAPIVIDSTPGKIPGPGDAYAEIIRAVRAGDSPGSNLHVGWWEVEESLHRRRVLDPVAFERSLTPDESVLIKSHAPLIDLERIAWRRAKIERAGLSRREALLKFKLAYPECIDDALSATVERDTVFDGEVMDRLALRDHGDDWRAPITWSFVRSKVPDRLEYDLLLRHRWGVDEIDLGEGYCRIWELPDPRPSTVGKVLSITALARRRETLYFAGIDTSDGREGGDWQVCAIENRRGGLAAILRCKIDPVRFAAYVQRLLEWYSAEGVVEAPHGSLVHRLIMGRYAGVDAPGEREGELDVLSRPFNGVCRLQATTGSNRGAIVAAGMSALETPGGCTDRETYIEMMAFHRGKDGRLEARSGAHDDIIISRGLAADCRRASQQRAISDRSPRVRRRSKRTKYNYLK